MKTKLTITLLLAAVAISGYAQNSKTVRAKLNDATVFFQGAELTHSASSGLTRGENEIIIEGLSPNIDRNSLKVKTTNGVIVSSSEFSVDYLAEAKTPSTAIKKLKDSIDYYQKKLDVVNTDVTITKNLQDLLQKGTDKNVAGSESGLGIDELVKTMDYYKAKSLELQNMQTANTKKQKELSTAINRLNKQLSQESLKNSKTSGILRLVLSAPATTNCNFTISYYTAAANWAPYYDINIVSTDQPIQIAAKSKVRQTTGLDWDKVNLKLSTATPSSGKVAPLFNTWFLDFQRQQELNTSINRLRQNSYSYEEKTARFNVETPSAIAAEAPLIVVDGQVVDAGYFDSIDPDKIKDVKFLNDGSQTQIYGSRAANGVTVVTLKSSMDDYITQRDTELNMVFEIDMPYTIPGNGKEQAIDLQKKTATAQYKYYCAPKLDTETYLLAEIADWQQLNLMSGKANITYDGTYVGETFIDAASTHTKLSLTLGTDKRVTVKREKMQDFNSGTKFLGNDTKQTFTYRLTVRNGQNKPVKIVLKDQYPVSTQKNIEVELLTKETTPWTANVEDLGVVTWEEELKAGETKIYQISYSVKYPKGSNLNL